MNNRYQHKPSQGALLLLVAVRIASVFGSVNMQSSVESSGYFENFSGDLDDYDLEDDDFSSANISFNGRLVIGGPSGWPVLGTGGKTYKTLAYLFKLIFALGVYPLVSISENIIPV